MITHEKISEESANLLLSELWEDSVFNSRSLDALQAVFSDEAKGKTVIESIRLHMHEIRYALTTSRNRNLIKPGQQDLLRSTTVGFFGLSVGSNAAITWVLESRADVIKIVDPDIVSPTNLNRLHFAWDTIGRKKTAVVTDIVKQINTETVVISSDSKNSADISALFTTTPRIDVIVDAIDDIKGKILLRKLCKKHKVPLVSAADVGDNVALDIERYDLEPQPEFFLGRVKNIDQIDFSSLSEKERRKLIIRLVGFEENSEEMLDSLFVLGDELGTWPQLGATATIAGGVVTTTIKKIRLGEKIMSGRYYLSLDSLIVSDFNTHQQKTKREKLIHAIIQKLDE